MVARAAILAILLGMALAASAAAPDRFPAGYPLIEGGEPAKQPNRDQLWRFEYPAMKEAALVDALRAAIKRSPWKLEVDRPGPKSILAARKGDTRVTAIAGTDRGRTWLIVVAASGRPPEVADLEQVCEIYAAAQKVRASSGVGPAGDMLSTRLFERKGKTAMVDELLSLTAVMDAADRASLLVAWALEELGVVDFECPGFAAYYAKK